MRRARLWAAVAICVLLVAPSPVRAQTAEQNEKRGLFVTPVREYITVAPGKTQSKQVTVANFTDKPVSVSLSVEQFSVADYSYNYNFAPDSQHWLVLDEEQVELEPGKSKSITYIAQPPVNVTPGGHYFTVFATATIDNGSVKSQVRAATVVYVTVAGDLERTSVVQGFSIPRVSFGGDIDFTMDVKGTGNTHYFMQVAGELEGFTSNGRGPESTRLLMPGSTLKVGSSIPAPLLPGVYTAVFGYKEEDGEEVLRSQKIVYLPLWSLAVTVGLVWLVVVFVRKRRKVALFRAKDSSQQQYK
jgi:hypothetical protein